MDSVRREGPDRKGIAVNSGDADGAPLRVEVSEGLAGAHDDFAGGLAAELEAEDAGSASVRFGGDFQFELVFVAGEADVFDLDTAHDGLDFVLLPSLLNGKPGGVHEGVAAAFKVLQIPGVGYDGAEIGFVGHHGDGDGERHG